MRIVKFDEIGNVIEKEKMTGALFNIAWKVSRPRQVVRRDGSLGNAELEQKDNPYLNVSKGVVELTTRSWLSSSKLFFDMKLQEKQSETMIIYGLFLAELKKIQNLNLKFFCAFRKGCSRNFTNLSLSEAKFLI